MRFVVWMDASFRVIIRLFVNLWLGWAIVGGWEEEEVGLGVVVAVMVCYRVSRQMVATYSSYSLRAMSKINIADPYFLFSLV